MITTLKIGGKEIRCSLGLAFLGELLDELDMSIDDVGEKVQKNPFRMIPVMITTSHKVASELDGIDPIINLKEVVALLEEHGGIANTEVVRFLEVWTESMTKGVPKSESKSTEPKKK